MEKKRKDGKVLKWGNSYGIRLGKKDAVRLGWTDDIEISSVITEHIAMFWKTDEKISKKEATRLITFLLGMIWEGEETEQGDE